MPLLSPSEVWERCLGLIIHLPALGCWSTLQNPLHDCLLLQERTILLLMRPFKKRSSRGKLVAQVLLKSRSCLLAEAKQDTSQSLRLLGNMQLTLRIGSPTRVRCRSASSLNIGYRSCLCPWFDDFPFGHLRQWGNVPMRPGSWLFRVLGAPARLCLFDIWLSWISMPRGCRCGWLLVIDASTLCVSWVCAV